MKDIAFTKTETRAAVSLASVYGLRMFGLFLVLPVLATYAKGYTDYSLAAVGLAIGIYGLTQSLFQIPLGLLSDRVGRKPVIVGGLLVFAFGSWMAAMATSMQGLIIGRAIQGCGAIASALMALAADVSREERRSHMMAVLGMSIGASFVVALIAGPILAAKYQLSGLFLITSGLSLLAIAVVFWVVPDVKQQIRDRDVLPALKQVKNVLLNGQLTRLDFGIFSLHFLLSSSFVDLPILLEQSGIPKEKHAWIYLPVMLVAFIGMVPGIIIAEKKRLHARVMGVAIVLLLVAQLTWLESSSSSWLISGLVIFFLGFNLLEAMLPSMVSRFAPVAGKGTAMGVYSTSQFMGSFLGGALTGVIGEYFGGGAVFMTGSVIVIIWLLVHKGQHNAPALTSLTIDLPEKPINTEKMAELLRQPGIKEAMLMEKDHMLYIKYDTEQLDGIEAKQLIDHYVLGCG